MITDACKKDMVSDLVSKAYFFNNFFCCCGDFQNKTVNMARPSKTHFM